MSSEKIAVCPRCHQPLRPMLQKGAKGRKYRCIDCEGEDPLHSTEVSKLLRSVQPPS